jgi:hypothetical protein
MEKFKVVKTEKGWISRPIGKGKHPLLSRLYGGEEEVGKAVEHEGGLREWLDHIRSVAKGMGMFAHACGAVKTEPTIILREMPSSKPAKAWRKGVEAVIRALAPYDSGRWSYDKIHCCITGKDADLEPWGQQGIEIVTADRKTVTIRVHGGKTFAGTDACLNLPKRIEKSRKLMEKAVDAFLEQAQEVVCGTYTGYGDTEGGWTGDDWYLSFNITAKLRWSRTRTGRISFRRTARRIHDKANALIEPWAKEMALADRLMSQLAGWIDGNGKRCRAGRPSACAASRMYRIGVKS